MYDYSKHSANNVHVELQSLVQNGIHSSDWPKFMNKYGRPSKWLYNWALSAHIHAITIARCGSDDALSVSFVGTVCCWRGPSTLLPLCNRRENIGRILWMCRKLFATNDCIRITKHAAASLWWLESEDPRAFPLNSHAHSISLQFFRIHSRPTIFG